MEDRDETAARIGRGGFLDFCHSPCVACDLRWRESNGSNFSLFFEAHTGAVMSLMVYRIIVGDESGRMGGAPVENRGG